MLLNKLRNIVRALFQLYGSKTQKRRLWDREFASGRWDYIDHTQHDCIYSFVIKYCRKGAILDLGCGAGNTGTELPADAYTSYTGIDISPIAIEKAREKCSRLHRSGQNTYEVGDIASFEPTGKFNVILFRESIFYVRLGRIASMLKHYQSHLRPDGVFIVRMYDRHRYEDIISLIKSTHDIVEIAFPNAVGTVVIVFK